MRPICKTLFVACAVLLGACQSKDRFVKPVATSIDPAAVVGNPSQYKDGYLRIFVTSNLDKTGRMLDFGSGDGRPAKLLISARFGKGTVASFAATAEPEIPVLLYDIQSDKVESSIVDNALLTDGLLMDPESMSRSPHLQIIVRGVPADKAKWVTNLLSMATDEPVLSVGLSFVPGAAAFSPLSTKLGDLLSEEIKTSEKPWEEKTLLGLRADEGISSLDGRQFVVLLNPSKVELEAPPKLVRCENRGPVTGLCRGDGSGEPWIPTQAYVRFELDVTDFRSIKDFIAAGLSCETEERTWIDYRALLASGQLARRQTEYERLLLARGELLTQIRRSQSEYSATRYVSRLMQHAQQFAMLQTPNDAYWQEHFRERANQLDACVRTAAIRGLSQNASIWELSTSIFSQTPFYPAWAATLAASADPSAPVLRQAEEQLRQIGQLLTLSEAKMLDSQNLEAVNSLSAQLQQMLLPSYGQILDTIEAAAEPVQGKLDRIADLNARSACAACKQVFLQRSEALRASLAPPPVTEPEAAVVPQPPSS